MKISENEKENNNATEELFTLNVSEEHKFYQTVKNANRLLKEHSKVILIGEGIVANKAIAIADTIKRQSKKLTENIEVCSTNYKDVWIPKSKELGLENLEITRAVPTTKILLVYNLSEEKTHDKTEIKDKSEHQGKANKGAHRYYCKEKREYQQQKNHNRSQNQTRNEDKTILDKKNHLKADSKPKGKLLDSKQAGSLNRVDQSEECHGKKSSNSKRFSGKFKSCSQQPNNKKHHHQPSKSYDQEQHTTSHVNETGIHEE